MRKLLLLALFLNAALLAGRFWQELDADAQEPNCVTMNGDINGDGELDVSDPITLLSYLFLGEPSQLLPTCDAVDRVAQEIHVDDFGASGNGVDDDTQAIQNALDAAVNQGREVHFRSGATYLVKGLLIRGGDLHIEGHNATIKYLSNSRNRLYVIASEGAVTDVEAFYTHRPIKISNLKIDALDDSNGLRAKYCVVHASWNSDLIDMEVMNAEEDGILITGVNLVNNKQLESSSMVNNRLTRCRIRRNGGNAIHIRDPRRNRLTDTHIKEGFIYNNGGWGVFADAGAGMHITGIHFYANDSGSIFIDSAGFGTIVDSIYSEDGMGFRAANQLTGAAPVMIQNCVFKGKVTHDGGGDASPYGLRSVGNQYQEEGHLYHNRSDARRKIISQQDSFESPRPFQWHDSTSEGEFVVLGSWLNYYGNAITGKFNALQEYIDLDSIQSKKDIFLWGNQRFDVDINLPKMKPDGAYVAEIDAAARRFHTLDPTLIYSSKMVIQRKQETDEYAITNIYKNFTSDHWAQRPRYWVSVVDADNIKMTITGQPLSSEGFGSLKVRFR